MRIFIFFIFGILGSSDEDTIIDMTPGGMPPPLHRVVGDMSSKPINLIIRSRLVFS